MPRLYKMYLKDAICGDSQQPPLPNCSVYDTRKQLCFAFLLHDHYEALIFGSSGERLLSLALTIIVIVVFIARLKHYFLLVPVESCHLNK